MVYLCFWNQKLKIMEEKMETMLKNQFENIKDGKIKDFQKECEKIAQLLFSKYCINCNGTEYYFAEIEFYYWKFDWKEKEWTKVTYARNSKAGDLFFHLSGIDICFESNCMEDKPKFGGILIRAVMNENNKITAGPLNCKDEILNECQGKEMPMLKLIKKRERNPIVKQTNRLLGKNDMQKNIDENENLCFYDSNISIEDWNPYKEKFDKKKGSIISRKGCYNTDRFK